MAENPTKIAFLIDEQSLMRSFVSFDTLLSCIRRILVFYHYLSSDVLWSFRFFSSVTRYGYVGMRHFHPINTQLLKNISVEYQKREKERPNTTTPGTILSRINLLLKETLGDFQWESSDPQESENYVFIFTACPSSESEASDFFIGSQVLEDVEEGGIWEIYREQLSREIEKDHKEMYNERNISVSIIDTNANANVDANSSLFDFGKFSFNKEIRQFILPTIRKFKGNLFTVQNITQLHGPHRRSHFLNDLANFVPHNDVPLPECDSPPPAWKGTFEIREGQKLGNFLLYVSRKQPADSSMQYITFAKTIRVIDIIHTSQFSPAWTLGKHDHVFHMVHEYGLDTNRSFNELLNQLSGRSAMAIVELIPINGFEQYRRTGCLEFYTDHCASLRILETEINLSSLPSPTELDDINPLETVVNITHPHPFKPLGPLKDDKPSLNINLGLPDHIKKLLVKNGLLNEHKKSEDKQKGDENEEEKHDEEEELVIELPSTVAQFEKQIKKLYFDTLYFREYHLEHLITILRTIIEHLLKLGVPIEQIFRVLQNNTLTSEELDTKHKEMIVGCEFDIKADPHSTEHQYQVEWWRGVKEYREYSEEHRTLSLVCLRLKESQLQVILYTIMSKLLTETSVEDISLSTTTDLAEAFFVKMVLAFMHNKVEEFVSDLDAEEGADAIASRDPCDLSDKTFAFLLEDKFKDCLPELVESFKGAAGEDDMMSIQDDGEEDLFALQIAENNTANTLSQPNSDLQGHLEPEFSYTQKHNIPKTSNKKHDKHSSSGNKTTKHKGKSTSKLDLKSLLPPKKSENNLLNNFMKRTISMDTRTDTSTRGQMSEAAKAALDKIERSKVDGKPTMKRSGSFIKSANSPRRPRTVQHTEGPVVVKRAKTVYDPEMTPRRALSQFLKTDIFSEYSEYCVSPTKDTAAKPKMIPSAYPRATPHRHEEGTSFSTLETLIQEETVESVSFNERLQVMEAEMEEAPSLFMSQEERKSRVDSLFDDED